MLKRKFHFCRNKGFGGIECMLNCQLIPRELPSHGNYLHLNNLSSFSLWFQIEYFFYGSSTWTTACKQQCLFNLWLFIENIIKGVGFYVACIGYVFPTIMNNATHAIYLCQLWNKYCNFFCFDLECVCCNSPGGICVVGFLLTLTDCLCGF